MVKLSLIIFLILLGFLGPQGEIIPIATFKIILLLAGSALVFYLLSLSKWKNIEGDLFKFTSLSGLFLLFLLWSALGYFYSADPERSVVISIQSLSAILLYLGLSNYIQKNNQVTMVLKFVLSFMGIISLVGIMQKLGLHILANPIGPDKILVGYDPNSYGINSLFIHRNTFSGYLVFLIPIPCLVYQLNWSKRWNLIATVVLVLSFLALGLSASRGGALVGIFQMIMVTGYLLFNKKIKGLVHLFLAILISLFLYKTINQIIDVNLSSLEKGIQPLNNLVTNIIVYPHSHQSLKRILFWQGAWEIIKDHWLIGSGPLSFNLLFPKYYFYITPLINNQILTTSPPHAHNIFLQTAADSGLIGIGLMLSFLAVFYHGSYKNYKKSILKNRTTIFFIVLAVTSFLLHNMIEYNWPGSMFIYNFTIFIFIINFIGRNEITAREAGPPNYNFYVVPIVGILAIFLTIKFSIQYYQFTNIMSEKLSQVTKLNESQSIALRAKKICPRCDSPYIKLGSNMLLRFKENNDDKLVVLAKKELLEGQKLNPYNPHYMGFLAQIFAIEGEYSRAQLFFKQALKFNRTHSTKNYGLSMEQLRKIDQAASYKK